MMRVLALKTGGLPALRIAGLRVKPWVLVLTIVVLALLGFYASLAVRFLNARSQEQVIRADVARLEALLRNPGADTAKLQSGLSAAEAEWDQAGLAFSVNGRESLLTIVAAAARDTNVALSRVMFADSGMVTIGTVRYAVDKADLWVTGSVPALLSFVDLLGERSPMADLAVLELAGVQQSPTAQVRAVFYSSPQQIVVQPTPQPTATKEKAKP